MSRQVSANDSPRLGTLIESEEDIRRALLANPPAIPVAVPVVVNTPAATKPPDAALFRPTLRPPICTLTILDDGKSEGEIVRVRGNRFVIGRTEGDFLLPHDEQVSS